MFVSKEKLRAVVSVASLFVATAGFVPSAKAITGNFLAVLNESSNNGDSRKSIVYYDADHVSAGPLFSVFVPFEDGISNVEEPEAITMDPATGDTYVLAFDNNVAPSVIPQTGMIGTVSDGTGDWDLYKINFANVYNNWVANYKGKDVRALGLVSGPPPIATANDPNPANPKPSYVSYAVHNPYNVASPQDNNANNSNQVLLPGAIEKVGEVARNVYNGATSPFFIPAMEFVDSNTLFITDDALEPKSADNQLNDQAYRILKKASDSPGAAPPITLVDRSATPGAISYYNGGLNGGAGVTQSWGSTLQAFANRDSVGHSELGTASYYKDVATGVQGVWVHESDNNRTTPTGDSLSFYQLDSNGNGLGYRPLSSTGNPDHWIADNDPLAGDAKGKIDHVFTDKDTGDVIIVESGFNDAVDGIDTVDREPAIERRHVNTYDNGSGQIDLGGYVDMGTGGTLTKKLYLNPAKDPSDTFLERGQWTQYDSKNDRVIFVEPGEQDSLSTPDDPLKDFAADIYILDLKTGITTSYLDVAASYALFNSNPTDSIIAFASLGGVQGDYNGNGIVDAADYTVWRDHLGQAFDLPNRDPSASGVISMADYTFWKDHFGATSGSGSLGSGAVPEPGSFALAAIGLVGLILGRRRFGR